MHRIGYLPAAGHGHSPGAGRAPTGGGFGWRRLVQVCRNRSVRFPLIVMMGLERGDA